MQRRLPVLRTAAKQNSFSLPLRSPLRLSRLLLLREPRSLLRDVKLVLHSLNSEAHPHDPVTVLESEWLYWILKG